MHLSIFLLSLSVVFATAKEHYLSDNFINQINQKQNTWTAGRNFDENTPDSQIKALLGVKERNASRLRRKSVKILRDLPENFDSREQWPECKSIMEIIRDQSACGSCWAVAAVSAMSDRICIASNGTTMVSLSANHLLSCCFDCGFGCNGGYTDEAWTYWFFSGIVSGGAYGSNEGCQTYKFPPCEHYGTPGSLPACGPKQATPKCSTECDKNSTLVYKDDLYFAKDFYSIDMDEGKIKSEIYKYGPVEASFSVYEDFINYKEGVYQHTQGEYMGSHAVKILGWGVENDVPYWLVANSWNKDWGNRGYFKIRRGNNERGIERNINAGIPK